MEITTNSLQTVTVNNNVLFEQTAIPGSCSIMHREGSGLVSLRGLTRQCRARFRVSFGANVALGTVGGEAPTEIAPIELAFALNGESVNTTSMIITPAVATDFNNVFRAIFVDVPAGCCTQVSVENVGTTPIQVQNANLIVERVA